MGVRIALDAFGGDLRPQPEVEAAIVAAREGIEVVLVGDEVVIARCLDRQLPIEDAATVARISVHHAPDAISMADSPARVVRARPKASMPVCFDLVAAGEADAVVSAGNSGAMLACGLFKSGRIRGVDRPAISTVFSTPRGSCCLLDMGVNVECKPVNFAQFAVMGAVFSQIRCGKKRPRVGVLSNGSEAGKGTDLTRSADRVLRAVASQDFDYRGYLEANQIFVDRVDVVVTDGFTGNVLLKVVEGTVDAFTIFMKQAIAQSRLSKVGALMMKSAFAEVRERIDPDNYGGAPLLGIRQTAVVCHGAASSLAIANGVRQAHDFVRSGLLSGLTDAITRNESLFAAARSQ